MKTFVYFARPIGLHGPVKIGCSAEPETRLLALMTWAPIPLEVAAKFQGDWKLERRIHGIFAASHSHREWFHPTPKLSELIFNLAQGVPVGALIDLSAPLLKFRTSRAGSYSDDRRRYLSYSSRIRIAFRKLPNLYAPHDVDEILSRWNGYGKYRRNGLVLLPVTPTPEQFGRLDEVIANPVPHAVPYEVRFPPDEEEAA